VIQVRVLQSRVIIIFSGTSTAGREGGRFSGSTGGDHACRLQTLTASRSLAVASVACCSRLKDWAMFAGGSVHAAV
jgi:hypothetical protein